MKMTFELAASAPMGGLGGGEDPPSHGIIDDDGDGDDDDDDDDGDDDGDGDD